MNIDLINGLFELIGGFVCWINVRQLYKDKKLAGIYWPVQAFFSAWGLWNLYYYPMLGQTMSFWGGLFLSTGNIAWVIMAIYYEKKAKLEYENAYADLMARFEDV